MIENWLGRGLSCPTVWQLKAADNVDNKERQCIIDFRSNGTQCLEKYRAVPLANTS